MTPRQLHAKLRHRTVFFADTPHGLWASDAFWAVAVGDDSPLVELLDDFNLAPEQMVVEVGRTVRRVSVDEEEKRLAGLVSIVERFARRKPGPLLRPRLLDGIRGSHLHVPNLDGSAWCALYDCGDAPPIAVDVGLRNVVEEMTGARSWHPGVKRKEMDPIVGVAADRVVGILMPVRVA